MSKFLARQLDGLVEYVPGEQPQDMKYIKLNTNESPYPPSPSVISAINTLEVENLRLYSDPDCRELKQALSKEYNVGFDHVYVSNGSDDILNFAFMAFGENGVAYPDISYGFYSVYADLYGLKSDVKPLRSDFTINAEDYIGINKMVVIANPNAPTGILLSLDDIERIVSSNPDNVVLIDEAYIDFGGESSYELTKKYKNLLVVQTYSKSRSMAGARLGFAIADKGIIDDLTKIKFSTNPYDINRLTQVAGAAALKNQDYYNDNCKRIIETREYTKNELLKLDFDVTDSKANFLFAKSNKISGQEFYEALKKRGILIRHFTAERIKDYNRITIGSRQEMETFIQNVREIVGG